MIETFQTPNGAKITLETREGTSDGAMSYGILSEDEYRLQGHHFSGQMIDIGAYIGAVGIALAVENPDLRVLMVEALPENGEAVRTNIAHNGVQDRIELLHAAAGDGSPMDVTHGYQHVPNEPDHYVQAGRYIGNMYAPRAAMVAERIVVEGITLSRLVNVTGPVSLLKLDCEGCEWQVLRDPAVKDCQTIIGEWHGDPGLGGIRELLPAFDVRMVNGNEVNGIFWATQS